MSGSSGMVYRLGMMIMGVGEIRVRSCFARCPHIRIDGWGTLGDGVEVVLWMMPDPTIPYGDHGAPRVRCGGLDVLDLLPFLWPSLRTSPNSPSRARMSSIRRATLRWCASRTGSLQRVFLDCW